MIRELDQTVTIPLLGSSRLPPETIHLPGTKRPPTPPYYQDRSTEYLRQPGHPQGRIDTTQGRSPVIANSVPPKTIAKAFVSYSHKDKEFLSQLHEHLSGLRREGLLVTWTDRDIHAGGVIDSDVDEQIEAANLYLLLVSSAFIESDYCYQKEFALSLERQKAGEATIVPIIIRECDWKIRDLRQFKALPEDGKAVSSGHWRDQDAAFANVVAGLRALIERGPLAGKTTPKGSKPPKACRDAS
jgi:hypothetical protein